MNTRYATDDEVTDWNAIINHNPSGGNILQGKEFIEQKSRAGWTGRFIMSDECALAVIEKSIPLLGKVWYCPKGPGVATVKQLAGLLSGLIDLARSQGVTSIKIEPELPHDTDMSPLITKFGLIKTAPVQYNYATVLVDLTPSLDDIMKSLNQKGRHAIRRAERDGVVVRQVAPTDDNCRTMYDMLRATGEGAGFPIRPFAYYRDFYQAYGDNGGLFIAYYDDQPVAGGFAMVQGGKSMYKDGASVRQRPAYGASHLLQWRIIEWAKQRGSKQHDLAGAPPIAHAHDQTHPFYAIGKFKRQFNNEVTEYIGAYNVPVASWKAKLWHSKLEKIIRKLYFITHKESWY